MGPEDLAVLKPLLVSESILSQSMTINADGEMEELVAPDTSEDTSSADHEAEILEQFGAPEMGSEEAFAKMQNGEVCESDFLTPPRPSSTHVLLVRF